MRDTIKSKIEEIKSRPSPQVFTRVTGYYRAVSNFNIGKQAEYANRLEYAV